MVSDSSAILKSPWTKACSIANLFPSLTPQGSRPFNVNLTDKEAAPAGRDLRPQEILLSKQEQLKLTCVQCLHSKNILDHLIFHWAKNKGSSLDISAQSTKAVQGFLYTLRSFNYLVTGIISTHFFFEIIREVISILFISHDSS